MGLSHRATKRPLESLPLISISSVLSSESSPVLSNLRRGHHLLEVLIVILSGSALGEYSVLGPHVYDQEPD